MRFKWTKQQQQNTQTNNSIQIVSITLSRASEREQHSAVLLNQAGGGQSKHFPGQHESTEEEEKARSLARYRTRDRTKTHEELANTCNKYNRKLVL